MVTWEQVEANEGYQSLKPEEKEQIKKRYESAQKASQSTQAPTATQPQEQTPTTAPSGSQELPSWDKVVNNEGYKSLKPEEQEQIKKRYEARGGVAEESSLIEQAGQAVNAGLGAMGAGINKGEAGLSNMLADKLQDIAPGVAGSLREHASGLTDFNKTVYAKQVEAGSYTQAGRLAGQYGETAGDIAVSIAQPELAIPMLAGKATGTAYENQEPGKKSASKALLVGTVDYAANKALPGLGGKVANTVLSRLGVTEAATKIAEKALGETATKTISNTLAKTVATPLKRVATNTAVGYVGGGASGTARAYSQGTDLGEGWKEGSTTGAVFGGTLSTVHELPGLTKAATKKVGDLTKERSVSDEVKQNILDQNQRVSEAKTATEQREALDTADHYNARRASKINNAYGAPTTNAMFKGNTAAQEAHGLTEKQANKDLADISNAQFAEREGSGKKNVINSKIEKAGADMKDSVNNSLQSGLTRLNEMKKNLGTELDATKSEATPTQGKARKEVTAPLNRFHNDYQAYIKAMKGTDPIAAKEASVKVKDSYDKLDPQDRTEFNNGFRHPEHFSEGFDPVAHAQEYFDARGQLESAHPEYAKGRTKAEKGEVLATSVSDLKSIPTLVKAPLSFVSRRMNNAQIKNNQKMIDSVSEGAELPATQLQLDTLKGLNHPEAGNTSLTRGEAMRLIRGGEPEPAASANVSPYEVKAKNRIAERQLELERNKIQSPDLKAKINTSNMADTGFIKSIQRQDAIRDVGKVREANKLTEKAKQNRRDDQNENSMNEVDRWHKEEANYISYSKYIKPEIEKAQIQTDKGGRLLSAARVKANALKAWQKDNPITATGTKAEFQHTLNKMNVDVRSSAKPIIDNLFANGKQPSPEALKRGWKDLHEIEAQAHEKAGNTSAAKAAREQATEKGKAIDKFVKTNKIASQHETLSNAMKESIKKAHDNLPDDVAKLTDAQQQEYIDTQIERAFKANNHEPLSTMQLDQLKTRLASEAETHANEHSTRSSVETEEILGDDKTLTEEAKKAFEETGKLSEESKQHVEDHIIQQTEKAFAEGDITKMKEGLGDVVNHYFRNDSARVHTLSKFIDNVDLSQRYKALYPDNPELWLTRTDVNNLSKAGNTHGNGMKSKLVDMILGKNYADQSVVSKMLTNAERKAKIDEIEAAKKASNRKGALAEQSAKPRLIRRNGKWVRKE